MLSLNLSVIIAVVVMRRILNNWGISLAAAVAVAAPVLFCGTATTQAEEDSDAKYHLLYPSVLGIGEKTGGNIKDQPIVIIGVVDRKASAPVITLDGKEVKGMTVTMADFDASWKGYKTHFYGSKENKPLTDLDKKSFFVAAIPVVPTGEKTLTIDGIDYKFKKVSSKDKTVTESYTHHSPFKVRNREGILPIKCEECHKVSEVDGRKVLGFAGTENCTHCHKDLSNHNHDMEQLKQCNMCHEPHASTIDKRLIDKKEVLCVQCHEAR